MTNEIKMIVPFVLMIALLMLSIQIPTYSMEFFVIFIAFVSVFMVNLIVHYLK